MTGSLQLLALLAMLALSSGASQRFYSYGRTRMLPKTGNSQCSAPMRAYRSLVMSNRRYSAFSVCSDGHIILLPTTKSRLVRYTKPSSLRYRRINAIVAGFWANTQYQCRTIPYRYYYTSGRCYYRYRRYYRRRSRYGRGRYYRYRYRYCPRRSRIRYRRVCPSSQVNYGQSCERNLMRRIGMLVNDAHFTPSAVMWATYHNMKPLKGNRKNNFQILLATRGSVTYVIFIYRSMGWDKSCRTCSGPYMGYTTGKGRGYQYNLPRSAARHLSHSIKIFRISDYQFSSTVTAQYDEEEVAKLQEALGGVAQDEDADDVAMTTEDDDDNDVAMTTEDDADNVAEATENDDDIAQTSEADGDDDITAAGEVNDNDDDDTAVSEEDDRIMTDADLSNTLKEAMQAALEEAEDDNTKHISSQDDLEKQEDKTSKKKEQRGVSNTAEKESGN